MSKDAKKECPRLPWMIDFSTTAKASTLGNQFQSAHSHSLQEYKENLTIKSKTPPKRLTKFVCTISPFISMEALDTLFENGMNVARLKMVNFTDMNKLNEVLQKIKIAADKYSLKVGRVYCLPIAFELGGTSIRTGKIKGGSKSLNLLEGQTTYITSDPAYKDLVCQDMIYMDCPDVTELVKPGDKILLGSQEVTLSALNVAEYIVKCIVEKAGRILNNEIVELVNAVVNVEDVFFKDEKAIETAIANRIDYLFLSNIINACNLVQVKEKLGEIGQQILVIPIIDNEQAIDNFDQILKRSDGIVVDTEKLACTLSKEKVFLVQRSIVAKCNRDGIPVLCTYDVGIIKKADILDISSSIIDGVDGLYLLEEFYEDNPNALKNLKVLDKICKESESAVYNKEVFIELAKPATVCLNPQDSVAIAAVEISLKLNAAAIIVITLSGRFAKLVAKYRPRCPIIAMTRNTSVAQNMHIYRAIDPFYSVKHLTNNSETDSINLWQLGITYGKCAGFIKYGEPIVAVKGYRLESGSINNIQVVYASSYDTTYINTPK